MKGYIKNKIKSLSGMKELPSPEPLLFFDGKSDAAYHKKILGITEANNTIKSAIVDKAPFMISRIGASELKIVNNYIVKNASSYNQWNGALIEELYTHSGVFPPTEIMAEAFSITYMNALRDADLLGVWNNVGESIIINLLAHHCKLCDLIDLEPFFVDDPWSQYLKGKKVLVVHPFEDSILSQYKNKRKSLFQNKNMLPLFDLKIVKAVQSISGADDRFENWTQGLHFLENEIAKIDFDIAIIGAGAYGLPLASYIKKSGKVAIHLGGASQLLFGLKGKRWMDREKYKKLFNDNWVFPDQAEKPEHGNKIDSIGPYWG
jgi:hypothetical protein